MTAFKLAVFVVFPGQSGAGNRYMNDPNSRGDEARAQMLYHANRKSTGVAYLLWFFFGALGGHRFYLGSIGTAVIQLVLLILGVLTSAVGIGLLILSALGLWLFIDLFLIPGIARKRNVGLVDRLTR
jgi:TM2 domain-containing membrane protein YozV